MTSYASNANRLAALAALPAEEADLISPFVKKLEQLDRGEREPETEAQKHFQLVCKEQLEPETKHEFAYIAYKRELLKVLQDDAFDAHKRELLKTLPVAPSVKRPRPGSAAHQRWSATGGRKNSSTKRVSGKRTKKRAEDQPIPSKTGVGYTSPVSGTHKTVSSAGDRKPAPGLPKRDSNPRNKWDIPEFEDGMPRPGFRPLGRYDRDE